MARANLIHHVSDDSAVGGQIIQGSVIFDDDHETFFHRDMVGGNRKVWTISYWIKFLDVNSTSAQRFWSAGDSGSGDVLKSEYYSGSSTRQIAFIDNNHAGSGIRFTTDAHLQDNAWYHIVMAVDTTVGTAANRVKIYINGELQTLWSSGSEHNHPPNQNYDTVMNKASTGLAFGRAYSFGAGSATHFEGQMSQLYLVDGQQLEPTSFGYTESQTGIWRPKKFIASGPNNGTTWSSNTSGNVYSGSAAGVFSGNLDSVGINGDGDANNNHFTVSSVNVVASKVGVRISNSSSDVEVSINGSVVGTIAQGNIATNIASIHTFTFTKTNVTSIKVRRTGSASGWFLYEIQLDDVPLVNGNVSNMGQNGFYYPLDGSHHITKDLSGNGNDSNPYNLRGTVPIHMATGGLPILNTNEGGTVARPGVRPDPLASNIVLALPLSNRYQAIGTDVHHLIKGSGSPKTLTNTGSVGSNASYFNFYGRSGCVNLENAANQRIEISASDDFNFGTGDFTVECWIYPKSTGAADGSLFVLQTTTGGEAYFAFNFDPGGEFNIYLNSGSASWSPTTPENLIEYTKWNHVALVKHSNVVKVYVNGLAIGSYSHSGQVGYNASVTTLCRIGGGGSGALNLYMQDMRIYKGVAKYTDTFTCASTDSSVIPDSPSGIAVPRKFRPSLSGSVGFDGSGDKITANSTDFVFGTDDFTIEATVYKTSMTFGGNNGALIFAQTDNNAGGRNGVALGYKSGGLWLLQGNGSGWAVETTVDVFPTDQWVHIAASKNSGTTRYFVNGKLVYTYSTNLNLSADNNGDISIGSINTTAFDWDGHISNFRIIKGTGLYTSSFTPPTEPLTNVTNTKLLCCQDKFSVTAKAVGPTLTAVGAVVTSDFSPFGDDTISRASSYAYFNRSRARRAGVVAESSLFLHGSNYALQFATAIFGPGYITSGKYIWEVDNHGGNGTSVQYIGINSEFDQGAGEIYSQANKTILSSHLHKLFNQTSTTANRTNEGQGTMTFLLDVDNRILRGYYDTRLIFTDTTIPNASTTSYAPFTFTTNDGYSGTHWCDSHFNFGQRPFIFTPPEGYETISSANIEPSTIINPRRHFECLTYTGNGSSSHRISGLEFQPDLVWIKSSSHNKWNILVDSIRGNNKNVSSNSTGAEFTEIHIPSFNSDGFTVADIDSGTANENGYSYVAWCWKAGGAAVTNNNGSVASQVSANKDAGFSIVTYTGSNDSTVTFGHGLDSAPEIVLIKRRNNGNGWRVYHHDIGLGKYLSLSNANAQNTSSQDFASVSATTFGVKGGYDPVSINGGTYVAYCWHSVPGYSKVGFYYGNGNLDGKFVYTGFKPAFVLLKRSTDSTNYWEIRDNKRVTNNPNNARLFPNVSDVQSVGEGIDFYNNGFKLRNSGTGSNSGDKAYIYMAFAEQPLTTPYGTQSNGE